MTNFFTACSSGYDHFVLPWITSALIHNPDAVAEVLVEDENQFKIGIKQLRLNFGDRVVISSMSKQWADWTEKAWRSSAIRFLEMPSIKSDYIYIGDIDIIILEPILAGHLHHMEVLNLPYSNIVRSGGHKRMTGLHFADFDKWYGSIKDLSCYQKWYGSEVTNDEQLLYHMAETGPGLPKEIPLWAEKYRPVHGIHTSPNRKIDGPINWGVNQHWSKRFKKLEQEKIWISMLPFFHPSYTSILTTIRKYIIDKNL